MKMKITSNGAIQELNRYFQQTYVECVDKEVRPLSAAVIQYAIDTIRRENMADREREERSKGCSYCTEYADLPEFYKNGEFVGRVFDTNIGFWSGNNPGWYLTVGNLDIAIAYCPMCGRKLKGADNG